MDPNALETFQRVQAIRSLMPGFDHEAMDRFRAKQAEVKQLEVDLLAAQEELKEIALEICRNEINKEGQ